MKKILICLLLIAPLSVFGQYTICFDQVGIINGPGTGTPTNPIWRYPYIQVSPLVIDMKASSSVSVLPWNSMTGNC